MFRDQCLICSSSKLERIIDLGMHPFADSFITSSRLSESEPVYPLSCDLCNNCGQIQTSCETNPIDRYTLHEYSYTSSNSEYAKNHWKEFSKNTLKKTKLEKGFVLEIGSNDGYLSSVFKDKNFNVLGIDPSQKMSILAKQRCIKTIRGLFNYNSSREISDNYGNPDLIIANNVFNHSDNPMEFTKSVSNILKKDGFFVFEVPYWKEDIRERKFDIIYHEHVNYFTIKSIKEVLSRSKMCISDIDFVNYHGCSLRIFANKNYRENQRVNELIEIEKKEGLFDPLTYENFMKEILNRRSKFLEKLYNLKSKSNTILAVGAAAKGNTFLNFNNLDNKIIDYVTDSSSLKQGKYTPLSRIPIVEDSIFEKYNKPSAVILSWNISHIIKKILNNINPNINYIEF